MFLAGPKFVNPLASKLTSALRRFDPGIIIYSQYNLQKIETQLKFISDEAEKL